MNRYVVAVTYEDGAVDHVGPFMSDTSAERYAAIRREHGERAVVHLLYRVGT